MVSVEPSPSTALTCQQHSRRLVLLSFFVVALIFLAGLSSPTPETNTTKRGGDTIREAPPHNEQQDTVGVDSDTNATIGRSPRGHPTTKGQPTFIDDSLPATSGGSVDTSENTKARSRQQSHRGRGHRSTTLPQPAWHLEGKNSVGHLVHGDDHSNVTCGSVFQRYDVESLKSDEGQQLFATRPVGCQRVGDGKDGKLLSLEECGVDKAASMLEAARIVADQKPKASDVLNVLSDTCPDDPRVAPAADHLVSCQERNRTRLVLPAPSRSALNATPGILVEELSVAGFVEAFQSLPIPQCDAWTYLRCQTHRNSGQVLEMAVVDVSRGNDQQRAQAAWPLLWPTWSNRNHAQFCGKMGTPARHFVLHDRPYVTLTKAKPLWHYFALNGSMFYRLTNVTHFQGQYFHSSFDNTPTSSTAKTDDSSSAGEQSAVEQPVASHPSSYLNVTGFFHHVVGQWPREVVSGLFIQPQSLLDPYVAKFSPAKETPQDMFLHVAYHLPAMDITFGHRTLVDGIMPMVHGLRHRLALGLKTTVIMERPLTSRYGFSKSGCFYGIDACIAHNPNDGGFAELIEFIAGGLDNIHFVDVPVNRGFPDAPGSIPEYDVLRKERAVLYSSTIFKIDQLFVGNPSQCAVTLTTDAALLENSDPIRLGKSNLDCGAMMAVFRDTVMAMVQTLSVREGRKAPAFLPKEMQNGPQQKPLPVDKKKPRKTKRVLGNNIGKRVQVHCLEDDTTDVSRRRFVSYRIGRSGPCWRDESWLALPNATIDPPVVVPTAAVHVVMVVHSTAAIGRTLVDEPNIVSAIRRHLTSSSVHTAGVGGEMSRTVRFTIAEVSSLRQAAQLFSSATLLILTHGAAVMYLPLLRPNTGVIVIDHHQPLAVPYLPTWIHLSLLQATCVGKATPCASMGYEESQIGIALEEERGVKELLNRIDALLEAQKRATILYY